MEYQNKEQFLIELEETFKNSTWDDITRLIDEVNRHQIEDKRVQSILENINRYNRISFRQWKTLRYHIALYKKKHKKIWKEKDF